MSLSHIHTHTHTHTHTDACTMFDDFREKLRYKYIRIKSSPHFLPRKGFPAISQTVYSKSNALSDFYSNTGTTHKLHKTWSNKPFGHLF